jgi:hypothetical protein
MLHSSYVAFGTPDLFSTISTTLSWLQALLLDLACGHNN